MCPLFFCEICNFSDAYMIISGISLGLQFKMSFPALTGILKAVDSIRLPD